MHNCFEIRWRISFYFPFPFTDVFINKATNVIFKKKAHSKHWVLHSLIIVIILLTYSTYFFLFLFLCPSLLSFFNFSAALYIVLKNRAAKIKVFPCWRNGEERSLCMSLWLLLYLMKISRRGVDYFVLIALGEQRSKYNWQGAGKSVTIILRMNWHNIPK